MNWEMRTEVVYGRRKGIHVVSSKGTVYPKKERWERPVTLADLAWGMEMNAMIGHEGRTHFDRKSRMKLF